MTKIMPWVTGSACLLYLYSWTQGIQYEAWTPFVWCLGCFANDFHNYLQHKNEP